MFHDYNAKPQRGNTAQNQIEELGCDRLDQLAYSPFVSTDANGHGRRTLSKHREVRKRVAATLHWQKGVKFVKFLLILASLILILIISEYGLGHTLITSYK